ncbi:MAG: PhnD/SsuA/transferrin family substrate-binding protein [Litoreibacter sp.]
MCFRLNGKQLAFTSPASNSASKALGAILKSDFDLILERDFEPVYLGKHGNSFLGVTHKHYLAASIANSVIIGS